MNRLGIDQINIILMLLSCAAAYAIPFELILISYAFLGPAHYLTEISWLHDRKYFTGASWSWIPLVLLTLGIVSLGWIGTGDTNIGYLFLTLALSFSIGMTAAKTWKTRLFIGALSFCFFLALRGIFPAMEVALFLLVPTVIHIFVFTGLFILSGALKSKDSWGLISFIVYIACGLSFLFITPSTWMISQDFIDQNLSNFDFIVDYIINVFSFGGRINEHTTLAFLSFAYTYHYLNWFSKTEIIKWHIIPRRRLIAITALYVLSISVYLYDFNTGFLVLTFLSLMHVLLEFPLNVVSVRMIGGSLRQRLKTSL